MDYNYNDYSKEEDSVKKYEEMLESGTSFYMTEDELDDVINYYTYNEKYKKALSAIDNSLALYPYDVSYYVKKSEVLTELGKMNEAIKAIDKAIVLEPSNSEHYIAKGDIYESFDEYIKAIEVFKEALKKEFSSSQFIIKIAINYHFAEKYQLAKSWILKINPKMTEDELILIEIAFGFSILEMQTESIDFFIKYTNEHPYSEKAWFLLSQMYAETANYKKALWAIEYAILINEIFYEFWNTKGYYFYKTEEYQQAIECYKTSLDLEPEISETYSYIGMCQLKLEDWQTARKNFKTALKYERENPDAWAGIGSSFILQNKFTEAVHYLKKALKLEPYNEKYQLELAKAYFNLDKYAAAENIYKSITNFNSENIEAWLDWSYLCWEKGEKNEAFNKLLFISHSFPPKAEILYRLAAYSLLNKKIKRGTELLEEALGLNFNKKDLFFKFAPEYKNSSAINELIDMYNPDNYYK